MVSGGFGGELRRRHHRQRERRSGPGRDRRHERQLRATSSPAPTTSTTRATPRSRTRSSSRAARTSPPPPRSTRRRGRSRPPTPASAPTTRSRSSTAATSPAPQRRSTPVLKANPDFQKALAQQGHLPQPRGPHRRAGRRQEGTPSKLLRRGEARRSPRPSPSTPSPRPESRPTRACSSCRSRVELSRIARPPGRDICRRPRTLKVRRGRPAQSRAADGEPGAAQRGPGDHSSDLRHGAVATRALGRGPLRAAPAPRAPRAPRAAPHRRLLLRLAAARLLRAAGPLREGRGRAAGGAPGQRRPRARGRPAHHQGLHRPARPLGLDARAARTPRSS